MDVFKKYVDTSYVKFSIFSTNISYQLEQALENSESTRLSESRSVRNVDRTVKDLQTQIERRDKQNAQVMDDLNKSRDKISKRTCVLSVNWRDGRTSAPSATAPLAFLVHQAVKQAVKRVRDEAVQSAC